MLKAATGRSFSSCAMTFMKPLSKVPHSVMFSTPARLVFAVYLGTFGTANSIDTINSFRSSDPPETVSSSAVKFVGTSMVATGLTVYKDSCMARYIGTRGISSAVPAMSYGLFAVRDAITIFASFNLPILVAPHLTKLPSTIQNRLGSFLQTESGRFKTAQFMIPAVTQFVTTPIHLLGLNMYNHPTELSLISRCRHVARDLQAAVMARIVRIVPAFGLGGIINASARKGMMTKVSHMNRQS